MQSILTAPISDHLCPLRLVRSLERLCLAACIARHGTFSFPTTLERLLWRIAAVLSAGLPVVAVLFGAFFWKCRFDLQEEDVRTAADAGNLDDCAVASFVPGCTALYHRRDFPQLVLSAS